MFCRTCGKEIIDEAVICPYCGCLTGVPQQPPVGQYGNQYVDQNGNPVSFDRYGNPNNPFNDRYGNYNIPQNMSSEPDEVNAGFVVLSVLIPLAGIILGATNMSSGKKKSGKAYLIAGLATWAAIFVLTFTIGLIAAFMN